MKKIKLFSLVAAALFAGSTMAQTTTLFDAADTGWTATGVDLTTGPTTVGEVTWNGRGSAAIATSSKTFDDNVKWNARLKFGGKSTFSTSKTMSGVLSFNVEKAGTVKVYCVGGGDGDRTTYISQTITSTTNDATTAIGSFTSSNQAIGIATAQVEAGAVYVWADNNVGVYGITFEASAPVTEPWIAFSKEELSLKVTPFVTKAEAELTLKGGNLAAGTYDLSLPTVTGLTITPTSVKVAADGTLNETITLSYTSKVNVEAASAVLTLTVGEQTASVTINYAARVDAYKQTIVTDSTTWDWSMAGATTIQFTEASDPKKSDTILLANVDGIANSEEFNSQALLVNGEYMIRDGKFFQGGYISFNVENAGTVQVVFSNTGDRKGDKTLTRYLYVNGQATTFGSGVTNANTTSDEIAVPAGKVEITFMLPDEAQGNQYCRVYSITYRVKKDIGSAVEAAQVETKAVKVIRDGQLLIIREGKTYTAQGVQVQ